MYSLPFAIANVFIVTVSIDMYAGMRHQKCGFGPENAASGSGMRSLKCGNAEL